MRWLPEHPPNEIDIVDEHVDCDTTASLHVRMPLIGRPIRLLATSTERRDRRNTDVTATYGRCERSIFGKITDNVADSNNTVMRCGSRLDGKRIIKRSGHRLLDKDMSSVLQHAFGNRAMRVSWRCDEHGLDSLVSQHIVDGYKCRHVMRRGKRVTLCCIVRCDANQMNVRAQRCTCCML
jgi:hypothetical protein